MKHISKEMLFHTIGNIPHNICNQNPIKNGERIEINPENNFVVESQFHIARINTAQIMVVIIV